MGSLPLIASDEDSPDEDFRKPLNLPFAGAVSSSQDRSRRSLMDESEHSQLMESLRDDVYTGAPIGHFASAASREGESFKLFCS